MTTKLGSGGRPGAEEDGPLFVLPPGSSTGVVSLLAIVAAITLAATHSKISSWNKQISFVHDYYVAVIVICGLMTLEIIQQLLYLKKFYLLIKIISVIALLIPNLFFAISSFDEDAQLVHATAMRCMSIVRYWCTLNLLSTLDAQYWKQSTVVARVCYVNVIYCLLQTRPHVVGKQTLVCNAVFYFCFMVIVLVLCGRYLHVYLDSKEAARRRRDMAFASANMEQRNQLRIETLIRTSFTYLLALTALYAFILELYIAVHGTTSLSDGYLSFALTFDLCLMAAICMTLGRSEMCGTDENQGALQSRIILLQGFASVFTSPFSCVPYGLKLLLRDLRHSGLPAEWRDTICTLYTAWRNTQDIFDDIKICEIFEDKAIKLETAKFPVLSFVQKTAKKLVDQAERENISLVVLGGPLTELDFENVRFEVDSQKLSSALRAIVSSMLSCSWRGTEVMVNVRKLYLGVAEPKFMDNTGLSRVRIEIQNKKMDPDIYPVGENNVLGSFAHFMAATDNDTGLGLWIASSTVRQHTDGEVGLEKRMPNSDSKYAEFCFYIELPVFCDTKESPEIEDYDLLPDQGMGGIDDLNMVQTAPYKDSDLINRDFGSMESLFDADSILEEMTDHIDGSVPEPSQAGSNKESTGVPGSRNSRPSPSSSPGPRSFIEVHFSKILMVDDDQLVSKMQLKLFSAMNLADEILSARSGQEAIAIIEKSMAGADQIELIFLDYMMPVVDGPEVASTLRRMGYRGIIVGLTALNETESDEFFINCGANLVLHKPLKTDMLHSALWKLMSTAEL